MKGLFLVLVYVFNFNLFEFSAAILEKGLLRSMRDELQCLFRGRGERGTQRGTRRDVKEYKNSD